MAPASVSKRSSSRIQKIKDDEIKNPKPKQQRYQIEDLSSIKPLKKKSKKLHSSSSSSSEHLDNIAPDNGHVAQLPPIAPDNINIGHVTQSLPADSPIVVDNNNIGQVAQSIQSEVPIVVDNDNIGQVERLLPEEVPIGVDNDNIGQVERLLPEEVPIVVDNDNIGQVAGGNRSDKALATECLRTFNKHYLHAVQEEETRCGKVKGSKTKAGGKAKGSKTMKGSAPQDDAKRGSKRPDLKAITKMTETNAILKPDNRIGPIPGIDVGHQFFSRAEMVVVGFHSHWLWGIDYIGIPNSHKAKRNASKAYDNYTLPLATCIVLSGMYEDDIDNCDDVVYTGQGGNNLLGDKHQARDQVMDRGNLALKNCVKQGTPVRVVRGHQSKNSYVGKVYTYDGLYKVVEYWAEKGLSGFTVYKFRLKRIEGQPLLTTSQVLFARGRIPNSVAEIRGLVCEDITGGLENLTIPATNLVDDPPVAPSGFTYCKSNQVSESVKIPENAAGCDCKGSCTDAKICSCAKLNGADFPYVHRDGGRLIEPKAIVFECGPNCGCGPGCVNRTSQRAMKYKLEVFRTPKKGWGVRSWEYIPSGAPVCEYIGVLMRTDEVDTAHENYYMFDIDCLETMKGLDGRERRMGDVSLPVHLQKNDDNRPDSAPEFCIDAGSKGNITRFINHSCQPNLFVQCVLSSHHDIRLARVVLFAADNIPPLQELTYDYGYILDSVMGPDGKPKQVACYCGSEDCRKRLI